MLTIYVVSDSTGHTAERMARSALVQFTDAPVRVIRRGQVLAAEQIRDLVEEAAGQQSIILHTLVANELRATMLEECRRANVDAMDMLGPLLDRLAVRLKLTPQEKPGLLKQLTEATSRQIEAVEFAFAHDDGHKSDDLDRAEIVLVGASRTMKTPTMLYLAYRGWFVANVPLMPELAPPVALTAVSPQRVFCFSMNPGRLAELRRARAEAENIPLEPYATPEQIRKELRHTERLCLEHRWNQINVTGKSVEEVGREIIARMPNRDL